MKASTNEIPKKEKKNPGGRPRTTKGSPGAKTSQVVWKDVTDPAGSQNLYQISNRGEVRRKLKSGRYKAVKSWVTGGPYAAVYLYGFKNATRHRKKVYIHRLVAKHFVKGEKKGKVVHHLKGPNNNAADQLQWTSVEDNLKARKYLDPVTAKPRKKVKKKVQSINALKDKGKHKEVPQQKQTDDTPHPLPKEEKLADKDDFIPGTETLAGKMKYLAKESMEFRSAYMKAKLSLKKRGIKLNSGNIHKLLKESTGKGLKLEDKRSPHSWKTKLISALHAIVTRLKS